MKLLTKADLRKLQSQDPYDPTGPGRELPASEALALVKFFTPDAQWTWFAVSASQDPDTGDVQFFGLVHGLERELGYFWLSELERVRGPLGLPVERDLYWDPVPLSDLID
jgi:hypothetical protein